MPVDFVPDPCIGLVIFQCLINKGCSLEDIVKDLLNPLEDLAAPFDLAFGDLIDVTVSINEVNVCLVAALTQAMVIAAVPLPTFPPPIPAPDFSTPVNELSSMGTEISDELGYLDSTFTIEKSGDSVTRIQSA